LLESELSNAKSTIEDLEIRMDVAGGAEAGNSTRVRFFNIIICFYLFVDFFMMFTPEQCIFSNSLRFGREVGEEMSGAEERERRGREAAEGSAYRLRHPHRGLQREAETTQDAPCEEQKYNSRKVDTLLFCSVLSLSYFALYCTLQCSALLHHTSENALH